MHLVLLSGGSGKRLWPLSSDVRAKQFLKLIEDGYGNLESMAQRTCRQIKEVGGWESVTVVANEGQYELLRIQLGREIDIVVEPERRDTFPAIALAMSYLHSVKKLSEDANIAVLPIDAFVGLDFFKLVSTIKNDLDADAERLVLIGSKPTAPVEKYGYIVDDQGLYGRVVFKEKPNHNLAKELIAQGAYWNCGVFGFKLSYFVQLMQDNFNDIGVEYNAVKQNYRLLPKRSFDYEVVEKANKISVLKYDGDWKDLGTWDNFLEEAQQGYGNELVYKDLCENTHSINTLNIPLVLVGIKDSIVVATQEGILVGNRENIDDVKNIVSGFNTRPVFEERRWGTYEVIHHTKRENESLTKHLIIKQGEQISYQYHQHRKEIWTIISGSGLLYINDGKSIVEVGDVVNIDVGMKHGIKALTDLEIIEVQLGSPLIEEDIVRLKYDW